MSTTPSTLVPFLRRLLALVSIQLGVSLSLAQGGATGVIVGSVSNVATGQNLEGAQITLAPGNLSVITARDGRFVVPAVPPGAYTCTPSRSPIRVSIPNRSTPGWPRAPRPGTMSGYWKETGFSGGRIGC